MPSLQISDLVVVPVPRDEPAPSADPIVVLDQPATSAQSTATGGHRAVILVLCCLGAFLAFLDATIVNIAFPAIEHSFSGSGLSSLSWILNSYNVLIAALLVPAGRLADRLGRRAVFLTGVSTFTIASAACGGAPDVGLLIAARVVQACGAALLLPASLALLLPMFPPERRQQAAAFWAAVAAIAAGIGPSLGGFLVQESSWRWVFIVNVPLGIAAMLLGPRYLQETRDETTDEPDWIGTGMLVIGVASFTLGVVKGHELGWTSGWIDLTWVIAIVAVAGAVQRSRQHPAPALDLGLLRTKSMGVANLGTVLFATALFAAILNNVLFLTGVWHWSILHAGLAVTPTPLLSAAVARPSGKLADKHGAAWVVFPGVLIYAAGLVLLHTLTPHGPSFLAHWLPGTSLMGIGIGIAFPTLGGAALNDIPVEKFGAASGLNSACRQLGAVIGVSVLVVVVESAGTDPMAGAEHGWLFCLGVALGCAVVSLALPRHPAVHYTTITVP